MQSNTNTRHYLVTCSCRDNTTQKWYTWTSRILKEDAVETALDTYHARQLEKNCTLEGVRITSSDDPRFPSVWQKLVDDRELTYKSKFHQITSEFKDSLQIQVRYQSDAYRERRHEAMVLHAQKLSEARAVLEAKQRAD